MSIEKFLEEAKEVIKKIEGGEELTDLKRKALVVHVHYLYSQILRELLKQREKRPTLQLVGSKAQDVANINNELIIKSDNTLIENQVEKARILEEEESSSNGGRPGVLGQNEFYNNFKKVMKYVVDMR
jgi:hypothetical protein